MIDRVTPERIAEMKTQAEIAHRHFLETPNVDGVVKVNEVSFRPDIILDLLADLTDAQKSRHELSVELVVVRNELADKEARIEKSEKALLDMGDEVFKRKKRLSELEAENAELRATDVHAELEAQNAALNADLAKTREEIKQLESQLEEVINREPDY
jgi:chromosome segregation ATPase